MKSQPTYVFRNNGILVGLGLAVLFGIIFFSSLSSTSNFISTDNVDSQIINPPHLMNQKSEDAPNDESEILSSRNLYSGPFAMLD